MRSLLLVCALAGVASAHPPPEPENETDWRELRPLFDFSTWVRGGWGVEATPTTIAPRSTVYVGPTRDQHTTWGWGLGYDVTLPAGPLRIGPYFEVADGEPTVGAEVVVEKVPRDFDMFFYNGQGVLIARAGAGPRDRTAAIAWGYRCPWKLWGPYSGTARYEIGARLVLAATYRDANEWSTTLGLEVEPVGAIRYLLGIRSWY